MRNLILPILVSLSITMLQAQQELGDVKWLRDYDTAVQEAEKSNKLIFILFQEVPGCATCRNYGDNVLSHPLLVDAIEHEFVPLAIYNNKGGKDKKTLEYFGEPSWNNPVVRIVDATGKTILERHSGDYSSAGLVSYMDLALRAAGKGSPKYLQLLNEELSSHNEETAYYQMYCFWSGEAHLGQQDGVVATEPGFMNGAEVVKVVFQPDVLDKGQLDKYAEKASCAAVSRKGKFRPDKDPQYYLKKSEYRYLPLADIQKTKINAAIKVGANPTEYLSPSQKEWLGTKSKKALYELPLEEAWMARKG